MVQLAMFQPRDPLIPLFFNVESSVGRQGQNSKRADILLVQYLIKKHGQRTPAPTAEGQAELKIMREVKTSGTVDDQTIRAIEAFQTGMRRKNPGTVVDGRVSVARNYGYGGGTIFTITALNGFVRRFYPEVWPRLHDLTDCPSDLKSLIPKIL